MIASRVLDGLVVLLATVGSVFDARTHRIPNRVTVVATIAGLVFAGVTLGSTGVARSALGTCVGLALLGLPFGLGLVGGGDVKFLMAFGALLGPRAAIEAFLWATAAGGLLSVAVLGVTRRGRNRALTSWIQFKNFLYTRDVSVLKPTSDRDTIAVPYGLALAFGGVVAHFGRGMLIG